MILLLLQFFVLLFPALPSSLSLSPSGNTVYDYGGIFPYTPTTILQPTAKQEISRLIASISSSSNLNNITIAPRGASHSTYGQANAPGGIVVDMLSLPTSIQVVKSTNSSCISYVDAGGGALWVDVLKQTLKYGLTPRSWTDYLHLTVGGTLSVGGISGQAFKYGPQITNVLELDVTTGNSTVISDIALCSKFGYPLRCQHSGKGEDYTCSAKDNSDLFYGVLGGFGQFGIITRARIVLQPARRMAKRVTIRYDDFTKFTTDQELLISTANVDYLEGFLKLENIDKHTSSSIKMPTHLSINTRIGPNRSNVHYSLELALYYDDEGKAQKILDHIFLQLRVKRSTVNIIDMSYFDFLNRVRGEEESLKRQGVLDVAHPWLNLFVPKVQIRRFNDLLLKTISADDSGGPIIIYPTFIQKWDRRMSAVVPQDASGSGIMYVASILRAAPLYCTNGTSCLDALLQQNEKILNIATGESDVRRTTTANEMMGVSDDEDGMGAKQYLPYLRNEMEWMAHFGEKWERFKELKSTFDPLNILTPGQRIFKRKPIVA